MREEKSFVAASAPEPCKSHNRMFVIDRRAETNVPGGFASMKISPLNHNNPLLFSEPKFNWLCHKCISVHSSTAHTDFDSEQPSAFKAMFKV